MKRTEVTEITPQDVARMVQHWLSTPENGFLGLDYGCNARELLHLPMAAASADDVLIKMRADIPVLATADPGAVDVYEVPNGADGRVVVFDVLGQVVATSQQGGYQPPSGAGPVTPFTSGAPPVVPVVTGYRYWRTTIRRWANSGTLEGLVSGSGAQARISELRYLTPDSVEWPTSAMSSATSPAPFVVTASGWTASFLPHTAFDKINADQGWVFGGTTGAGGVWIQPWLQIDMGSAQVFDRITLAPDSNVHTGGGYWIVDFDVEASATGLFDGEQVTKLTQTGLAQSSWTENTPRMFAF